MSAKVYVISDPHLGHENMAVHRGFKDAKEQDDLIVSNWNEVVKKGDTVYVLGDITMEKANYEILNSLKGYKKVVLGNHDSPSHARKMLDYVNCVSGMINYKKIAILTHCPIHPSELEYRFKINIHGHVHENTIDDNRYINVSCENINYTPILLDELIGL
jgi:calcineurin-like phosphoesterase family protein